MTVTYLKGNLIPSNKNQVDERNSFNGEQSESIVEKFKVSQNF